MLIILLFTFIGNKFDGNRAFYYLNKQVEFGSRVPNSIAHKQCLAYLDSVLAVYADTVIIQSFNTMGYGETLRLSNIIARFNPVQKNRLLLGAHWDSRPYCDHDKQLENRKKPLPAANDGASGVAVLLEIAQIISKWRVKPPVDIVLFDGEDYGKEGDNDMYLLGSKYLAEHNILHPEAMILLDMVGDKDLKIYKEGFSEKFSHNLNKEFFNIATRMYPKIFIDTVKYSMLDDHIPFVKAGTPAIDVIDFDYPYWHTIQDTPDKCSENSLKIIGDVLLKFIKEWR